MWWKILLAALAGAILGAVIDNLGWMPRSQPSVELDVEAYPLPHLIPKYPGGVALRLAMVHDVLHERFPVHGRAYYVQRNREVRDELAKLSRASDDVPSLDRTFALMDDLGAGLDRLSDDEEAVRVLRDKLRLQQARGRKGRDLYTTYANLGTFLIHGHFHGAIQGDAEARTRLAEGLEFLHRAIEVNPQAHFGRESWQAVLVEHLRSAFADPERLLQRDMVGDRLNAAIDPSERRCFQENWMNHGGGFYTKSYLSSEDSEDPSRLRQGITTVGAEEDGQESVRVHPAEPVPFDEPVLGILGMWRLGSGANPHFALALGEIMLRVGQRYLAWCAYERAADLKERFHPDPDIQRRFVAHCRSRQLLIEQLLPERERAELRPRFQAELAFGRHYQQAYQEFEARRIAEGIPLTDAHFYDAFHAEHGLIASPVGQSDMVSVAPSHYRLPRIPLGAMLFFAGLAAFLAASFARPRKRRIAFSPVASPLAGGRP